MFAAGFAVVFGLLYYLLGQQLEARELEALQLRLQQYADIYEANGVRGLNQRIDEDSDAPHVRSLFARLISPRGDVVWGRVPPDWIDQDGACTRCWESYRGVVRVVRFMKNLKIPKHWITQVDGASYGP